MLVKMNFSYGDPDGVILSEVKKSIEAIFAAFPRKKVFTITADGRELYGGPDSERWELPDFAGYSGIQRYYWQAVPGYADRVAQQLATICTGRQMAERFIYPDVAQ